MVADISQVPIGAMMEGSYTLTQSFVKYQNVKKGFIASTIDTNLGCIYFDCTIEKV